MPDNVSEIACDNTLFARNRYASAGIQLEAEMNLKLYPDPVSDVLNLECLSIGQAKVQIFTAMGELVYKKNNTSVNRMSVDVSTFSPGLYTLHLTGENQTVAKKIFVK